MLLFGIGPGIYALLISFADFSHGVPNYFAAGFRNYVTAFSDTRFAFTTGNLARYLGISVPAGIAVVVLLALLLQMRPGRALLAQLGKRIPAGIKQHENDPDVMFIGHAKKLIETADKTL